jgi:hypothetical protein
MGERYGRFGDKRLYHDPGPATEQYSVEAEPPAPRSVSKATWILTIGVALVLLIYFATSR